MRFPMASSPRSRRAPRLALLAAALVLGPAAAGAAEPPQKVGALDKLSVAVTDFTEAGRALPAASPSHPVYYIGVNAGFRAFTGIVLGGDPPPDEKPMLGVITSVLSEQGYHGADNTHPPTQIIVCSWGILGTTGHNLLGPGPGVHFLGGDKLDIIDRNPIPGHIDFGDVLRRRFRSGTAETVLQMTQGNLYAVLLRAYDFAAARRGERVQLWETRIACSTPGTTLAKSLPRLVVAGKHVIGRETAMPVVRNAARTRDAWVEIGESKVIEFIDISDLSRRRESPPAGTTTATEPGE